MNLAFSSSRRRFLLSMLAAAAAGRMLAACDSSTGSRAPEWLAKVTGERDAVVRIGKDYLKGVPAEQNLDVLMSTIERRIDPSTADDADAVAAALQQVVRGDYQRGEVVQVNRWILSSTEARLYAAVALLAG